MQDTSEYDFIVVGAGSAGSVLATRLSEDPAAHVLALEAGGTDIPDNVLNPSVWYTLFGSAVDWGYQSVPQLGLGGRQTYEPRGKLAASDQVVFIRCGDAYLELFQATGDTPAPAPGGAGPEYPAWRHLAFRVDDVDAKLDEMGTDARVTLGPVNFDDFIPGWRTVWVADPEGNIIEISQGYADQESPPPPPG